jgi:hypothetical protein
MAAPGVLSAALQSAIEAFGGEGTTNSRDFTIQPAGSRKYSLRVPVLGSHEPITMTFLAGGGDCDGAGALLAAAAALGVALDFPEDPPQPARPTTRTAAIAANPVLLPDMRSPLNRVVLEHNRTKPHGCSS